jgi:hypothetical protein
MTAGQHGFTRQQQQQQQQKQQEQKYERQVQQQDTGVAQLSKVITGMHYVCRTCTPPVADIRVNHRSHPMRQQLPCWLQGHLRLPCQQMRAVSHAACTCITGCCAQQD